MISINRIIVFRCLFFSFVYPPNFRKALMGYHVLISGTSSMNKRFGLFEPVQHWYV